MSEQAIRPTVTLGGAFHLTDHFGQAVTDEAYRGRFMLIFFGFSHCKVVCPENLAKLSQALELAGADASDVQPLYVTVDPDRDDPATLRRFLEERFPRFLGLTGEKAEIDRVKKLFKVYAQREEAGPDGDYDVPHSAMTFLMGRDGTYVTHFADVVPAERIAENLRARIEGAA
ncbi:SCO family protein [Novosphingobium sp. PS1R-30]|uniref:SCO family protein n=1 Tax=Novosphingobium anseongense TaxID=3133436 RepID=A0ABU8S1P2_9SPHN